MTTPLTNQTLFNEELEALIPSIWNAETYRSFYDKAYCLLQNVTLHDRQNAEGAVCDTGGCAR